MSRVHVYLVPGFFGFTSLGSFSYFYGVRDRLRERLAEQGLDARVHECHTQPTGSIRKRANRLLEEVVESGGLDDDEIHFVGHSTGGLDVRLLLTPGVRLRPGGLEERVASQVRSVVTMSTPHFGTPLASFFTTLQGRHLLQLLTMVATTNQARYGIWAAAQLLELTSRLDDWLGREHTILDSLSDRFLRHLTVDRNDPVWRFLDEVSHDQGSVIQLTPEGMNLFNAAVVDRPDTRYGSVVTAAPPPLAHRWRQFLYPERIVLIAVYTLMHRLAAREHSHYPYPSPAHELDSRIRRDLPFRLDARTNDAVVPTLSQVYGELIDVVVGDHLDVVGQYETDDDRLSDWLPSGSGFDDARFVELWHGIADYIAESSALTRRPGGERSSARGGSRGSSRRRSVPSS